MSREVDVRYQVMWNRLLAVVEEQAQTLVRTAFSTSARESGDISAGVFDAKGRMLAQAVTGTPGHVNCMALSVQHFIRRFPLEQMQPGDCFLTNDPWKGSGHLHDFTVVSPTFRNGRVVALFACTSHVVDIGGIGLSPEGKQIFFEGLQVPLTCFARAGIVNEELLELVRENVREPVQVEGDLYALSACNEIGGRRLNQIMDEYNLDSLEALADLIVDSTRQAMEAAIRDWPREQVTNAMTIDGFNRPVELKATLTIEDGRINVNYAGTSGISEFGINCPKCYTDAYTFFGIKCVLAPQLPNNAGLLAPISITAPERSIVHAQRPCAVAARAIIGHMLPDLIFGCLDQLKPDKVPAEGTSCLWNLRLGGGHGIVPPHDNFSPAFMITSFHSGGTGARPTADGLSATPFPSGVRNVAVEITEAITPVVIWRKELRSDSGGAGHFRGGLGQTMIAGSRDGSSVAVFATYDRVKFPPRGRRGGRPGAAGEIGLCSGKVLAAKGVQIVPPGDRLALNMPGGGGYGDPFSRPIEFVIDDVRAGYVSRQAAARDYGVVLGADLTLDVAATEKNRNGRAPIEHLAS